METNKLVQWIRELIKEDKLVKFYKSKEFRQVREEVLRESHYECQLCREQGKISRATVAHHIYYVRLYPQYALSIWIEDKEGNKIRNIIAVCSHCHEHIHYMDKVGKNKPKKKINDERW